MTSDDEQRVQLALRLIHSAEQSLDRPDPEAPLPRALVLGVQAVAKCRALDPAVPAHTRMLIRALGAQAEAAFEAQRADLARSALFEAAALLGAPVGEPPGPAAPHPLARHIGDLLETLADEHLARDRRPLPAGPGPLAVLRAAVHLLRPEPDGPPAARQAYAFAAWRLADLVDERHGPQAAVPATIAAVGALRGMPDAGLNAQPLAEALIELAIRCEHDPPRAVDAADEAVALYRAAFGAEPEGYRFDLARALFVASVYHGGLGRRPVALGTIEEAVELLRGAPPDDRHAARPLLAHCLHNLGLWTQPIRPRAAEPALREAVALYRALDAEQPGSHADDIATSLASLASLLAVHRHPEEAARLNDEALDRLRTLAEAGVDHMDGALADALVISGSLAHARGEPEIAAALWDEGIERLWPAYEAAPEERGYTTALLLACRLRLARREPRLGRDLSPLIEQFNRLQWPDGPGLVRRGRWTLDGPSDAPAAESPLATHTEHA